MMARLIFNYEFEDKGDGFDELLSLPSEARIEATADNENGIWISANQKGWEYIAKFAAQLALRTDCEKGSWHHHLDYTVDVQGVEFEELTFGLETWKRSEI